MTETLPPPRPTAEVIALPGAPARTLDGRLFTELSLQEQEIEMMKRRLREQIESVGD